MNDKLKPCPFCGGEAKIHKNKILPSLPTYSVYCTSCYAKSYTMFDKEKDAIESWNRRIENER